jgi:carbon-monoxide dehydrogenase large subunit
MGARLARKEDARLLTGRGRYVSDITLPGLLHVAFVRSPVAHAVIGRIDAEAARASPGVIAVVTGDDPVVRRHHLRARSELPGYVPTEQPVLAWPKVRHVGEAVAAIVATDRYVAEDAAEVVEVDWQPLHAVVDPVVAFGCPNGQPVHDEAPDNLLLRRRFDAGDGASVLAEADVVVHRRFRTNRQAAAPLEGRGGVASWDGAARELTLWSGTQVPHLVRHGLAEIIGIPEGSIRVVAPDVGGGFGAKAVLYPEDVMLCLLAMRLGRPVRWVEDRIEGLMASTHARDHHYEVVAGFDTGGRLLALDARILCNVGAYSVFPWTAGLEPLMAGGLLSGPYRLEHYRCEVLGVTTNTAPAGPYRGVARPATTFVMERVLDLGAAAAGIDPVEIRRRNLIGPDDLPYTSVTRLVHDASYPACLEQVVERIDYAGFRAAQTRARQAGRRLGIGFACYNELTGLGQAASAGPRMPFRTGLEGCTVRMDPSGAVAVLAGVTSQGQGLETTLAQVVAAELGVPFASVSVRFGDTDQSAFGFGAFSSRQGIIGSGAAILASRAVREKLLTIACHLLEASVDDLDVVDGHVVARDAPTRSIAVPELATVAYLEAHRMPPGVEPGLEATRFYDPVRGTFAAGAQAAVVEVDPETAELRILRFVCVEDAGRMINPMIVEGQVEGAIAQGIGGALYEHLIYNEDGQLVTASLLDYLLPTTMEIPALELGHVSVPADNLAKARGVGEGGTLGPAAALANAASDALGIEVNDLPITSSRLWEALR